MNAKQSEKLEEIHKQNSDKGSNAWVKMVQRYIDWMAAFEFFLRVDFLSWFDCKFWMIIWLFLLIILEMIFWCLSTWIEHASSLSSLELVSDSVKSACWRYFYCFMSFLRSDIYGLKNKFNLKKCIRKERSKFRDVSYNLQQKFWGINYSFAHDPQRELLRVISARKQLEHVQNLCTRVLPAENDERNVHWREVFKQYNYWHNSANFQARSAKRGNGRKNGRGDQEINWNNQVYWAEGWGLQEKESVRRFRNYFFYDVFMGWKINLT